MGRLRLAAIECSYKVLDRQLKEHFIHGLNKNHKLVEIIREFTKKQGSLRCNRWAKIVWVNRVETHSVSIKFFWYRYGLNLVVFDNCLEH